MFAGGKDVDNSRINIRYLLATIPCIFYTYVKMARYYERTVYTAYIFSHLLVSYVEFNVQSPHILLA